MKKVLIIILVVLLILCLGVVGTYVYFSRAQVAIADAVSDEAVLFLQLSDVKKNLTAIGQTAFWEKMRTVDVDRAIKKEKLSEEQKVMVDAFVAAIQKPETLQALDRVFGRETVLVAYKGEIDMTGVEQMDAKVTNRLIFEALAQFVLVTRVPPELQVIDPAQLLGISGQQMRIETSDYGTYEVISIVLDQSFAIYVTRIKDLLFLSLGDGALEKCIDAYRKETGRLSVKPAFLKAAAARLPAAGAVVFISVPDLLDSFLSLIKGTLMVAYHADQKQEGSTVRSKDLYDTQERFDQMLSRFKGVEAFSVSMTTGPVSKMKADILFNPQLLDAELASFYTCQNEINVTGDFVPQDVSVYQWANCIKVVSLWQQAITEIAASAGGISAIEGRIAAVEEQIGLSIAQDILPAFGEEIGWFLVSIKEGGTVPIPQAVLFTRVNDRRKMDQLMALLIKKQAISTETVSYKGQDIVSYALPADAPVRPAYCYVGDYLLVGVHSDLLKQAIDAYEQKAALPMAVDFQAIDTGMTKENRAVHFVRLGQHVEYKKKFVQWSATEAVKRNEQTNAFRAGTQRRLDDLMAQVAESEKELTEVKQKIGELEARIQEMTTTGGDVTADGAQRDQLKTRHDALQATIDAGYQTADELDATLQQYGQYIFDPAQRQADIEGVIVPLLDAVGTIVSVGARSVVADDILQTTILVPLRE